MSNWQSASPSQRSAVKDSATATADDRATQTCRAALQPLFHDRLPKFREAFTQFEAESPQAAAQVRALAERIAYDHASVRTLSECLDALEQWPATHITEHRVVAICSANLKAYADVIAEVQFAWPDPAGSSSPRGSFVDADGDGMDAAAAYLNAREQAQHRLDAASAVDGELFALHDHVTRAHGEVLALLELEELDPDGGVQLPNPQLSTDLRDKCVAGVRQNYEQFFTPTFTALENLRTELKASTFAQLGLRDAGAMVDLINDEYTDLLQLRLRAMAADENDLVGVALKILEKFDEIRTYLDPLHNGLTNPLVDYRVKERVRAIGKGVEATINNLDDAANGIRRRIQAAR